MNRPEIIETLGTAAKRIDDQQDSSGWNHLYRHVIELIRYVKVLERAVDNSSSTFTSAAQLIAEAAREIESQEGTR